MAFAADRWRAPRDGARKANSSNEWIVNPVWDPTDERRPNGWVPIEASFRAGLLLPRLRWRRLGVQQEGRSRPEWARDEAVGFQTRSARRGLRRRRGGREVRIRHAAGLANSWPFDRSSLLTARLRRSPQLRPRLQVRNSIHIPPSRLKPFRILLEVLEFAVLLLYVEMPCAVSGVLVDEISLDVCELVDWMLNNDFLTDERS